MTSQRLGRWQLTAGGGAGAGELPYELPYLQRARDATTQRRRLPTTEGERERRRGERREEEGEGERDKEEGRERRQRKGD